IEWVSLGSTGTQAAGNSTYGDQDKPIKGGMPEWDSSLSPEQIAEVVSFERVRFGGANADEVLADCGLAQPQGEEGSTPTTQPGAGSATQTTSGTEASASP
ncbi:MAG TPA: cytochrome c, partial [Longimicrobiales bacterium]|nr:cytochrome c [Longimicrobiales bacterium]